MNTSTLQVLITAAALFAAPATALSEDAIHAPAQKTIGVAKPRIVTSLIVMNARGATLDGGKLTLTGVSPNSIMFADRPVRAAGHALTAVLVQEWSGAASFAKDPPNATVSVLSKDGSAVQDAVVVLKSAKLEDDRLTFEVQVLEGGLAGADGPASVFIDTLDTPILSWLSGGAARATADQAAWYRSYGQYAQPTPSSQLGPAFMNNGMNAAPW